MQGGHIAATGPRRDSRMAWRVAVAEIHQPCIQDYRREKADSEGLGISQTKHSFSDCCQNIEPFKTYFNTKTLLDVPLTNQDSFRLYLQPSMLVLGGTV